MIFKRYLLIQHFVIILSLPFFIVTTLHAATISLPQTGQTSCFDVSGAIEPCANTGQDGETQSGMAWPTQRFSDNGNGTVTHNLTGLIWLANANCFGIVDWQSALDSANTLASDNNQCSLSDGSAAGDWRLPNINELESLIDLSQKSPAIPASNPFPFINVQSDWYWSSTTIAGVSTSAWSIRLDSGGIGETVVDGKKNNLFYVWPVKASSATLPLTGQTGCWDMNGIELPSCAGTGQDGDKIQGVTWPDPRFTNLDGSVPINGATVIDQLTGLMWVTDENLPSGTVNWIQALNYVADMNNGSEPNFGYSDWRLPNRKELLSLVNRQQSDNAVWHVQNGWYWSSDTYVPNLAARWMIEPSGASLYSSSLLDDYNPHLIPVRSTVIPDPPTIGTAVPGNIQATVSFTAPVSNGGSAITSYTVTSSPGAIAVTGASSPITVTGLTNGTAYTFTVTATNSAGTSNNSPASNSVTPATVPDAPTIGTAVPGNTQATVSFTAPVSNGGSAITSYTVTSNPGSITKTGAASPLTVTGLTNGTAYTFTVTAQNFIGTGAASAASNSVTPATAPGVPAIGTALPGNMQATVSFTAPVSNGGSAITSYRVTSNPGAIAVTGASSPLTVTGLTNGTAYTFTVTATNSAGTSNNSPASNSVTPATVPGAPTIGTALPGNIQATVSFTAPVSNGGSAITSYTVTSNPGSITKTGAASPIIVTGLSNGTAYTFTVTAQNIIGTGAASAASSSVTPATTPGAPTIGTAVPGNLQATVSFTAPASNGGSAITSYTVTSNPGSITKTGAASPITVTGLSNGTAYSFTVTATNSVGSGSASAVSNYVTPAQTPPSAPVSVTATAGNSLATISFSAPASTGGKTITGYTVTSNPGSITKTGAASPLTVTGLTNGTAYTFTVTAKNSIGTGPASEASNSVTPATVPGAPGIGTAVPGNAQAAVSFTAPVSNGGSAITGYTVTSNPGGLTATGSASPITVTSLINGSAYTFTVKATNNAGTGSASSASKSVIPIVSDGIVIAATGKTRPDISDALRVFKIAVGLIDQTAADLAHGDVAPLGSDKKPKGNGKIDIYDAMCILRMALGL